MPIALCRSHIALCARASFLISKCSALSGHVETLDDFQSFEITHILYLESKTSRNNFYNKILCSQLMLILYGFASAYPAQNGDHDQKE